MVTAHLPRVPSQLALQGVIPDTGPEDKSSSRIPKRKPGRSRAISGGVPTGTFTVFPGCAGLLIGFADRLRDWESCPTTLTT
jgi:hypothetical protein